MLSKKIFGSEANSDILISLLNAIFNQENDEIESIKLNDRTLEPDKRLIDTKDESKLKDWMQFVESENEEVLQMLAAKDEKIKKAYTVLTTISQDEKERHEYESREIALYDEISRLEDAKEEGLKEGFENGSKE
jgi:predicted transposase/invertase (TIGR01784 family)